MKDVSIFPGISVRLITWGMSLRINTYVCNNYNVSRLEGQVTECDRKRWSDFDDKIDRFTRTEKFNHFKLIIANSYTSKDLTFVKFQNWKYETWTTHFLPNKYTRKGK